MTTPRKHVFLIAGFDPKGGRYYRRLLAEAARARHVAGGPTPMVEVGPLAPDTLGGHWVLLAPTSADAGPASQGPAPEATAPLAICQFLSWHDIVRDRWAHGLRGWLGTQLRVAASVRILAAMRRVGQLARPAWWIAVTPLLLTAACLLLGLALGGAAWWGLVNTTAAGRSAAPLLPSTPGGVLAALTTALLAGAGVGLWIADLAHRRLGTQWIVQLCLHAIDFATDDLPALDRRLDEWADAIIRATMPDPKGAKGPEEVLIVGHSHGATLAIAALARALARAPRLADGPAQLSLLTLGHTTPMITAFPQAHRFRCAMANVQACHGLAWLDLVAAADWASFPGSPAWVNAWPVAGETDRMATMNGNDAGPATEAGRPAATPGPHVHAAPRFHRDMSPPQWQRLRGDRRALHLHYLRATSTGDGLDILRLLGGPGSLRETAMHWARAPASAIGPRYAAA